MDRRRTPTEHDLDELLDIIEGDETPLSEQEELVLYPELKDDVLNFLSSYKIEPGKDLVPYKGLYELYKQWSKTPCGKKEFPNRINKYLPAKAVDGKVYYYINRKVFDITNEVWKLILKHTRTAPKSEAHKKHFDLFLAKYNIKSGDYYIPNFALFNLYDQYTYEIDKKKPFGNEQFVAFCKLYFNHKYTNEHELWWGLDPIIKTIITEDKIKQLRENRKTTYVKKTNKKI